MRAACETTRMMARGGGRMVMRQRGRSGRHGVTTACLFLIWRANRLDHGGSDQIMVGEGIAVVTPGQPDQKLDVASGTFKRRSNESAHLKSG